MGEDKEEYKRFTVSLPQDLYKDFESFRETLDMTRSDCIRKAMRSYMISEEHISTASGNVVGCITIIMTHEHFDLEQQYTHDHSLDHDLPHKQDNFQDHIHHHERRYPHDLKHQHDHEYISRPIYASVHQTDHLLKTDIQHHFGDIIISTMHIHLEFEKCMEILAISGPYEQVKKLKNALQRLKSVLSLGFFVVDKDPNQKK